VSDQAFYRDIAATEWTRARRRAAVERLLEKVGLLRSRLLPFEAVRRRLHLRYCRYLGVQDVSLDKIVGSVDRSQDFTHTFSPRSTHLRGRWVRVATLVNAVGAPPIRLFKVGDAYFVLDGNHRTSIAHAQGAQAIEAEVCEYVPRGPLDEDAPLGEILLHCWWQETCLEAQLTDAGLNTNA
jgi:hypothetical protein